MPEKNIVAAKTTETVDFLDLEAKVDALIAIVKQLESENTTLKNRQKVLISEQAKLLDKTQRAQARVESMIARLHSMEVS